MSAADLPGMPGAPGAVMRRELTEQPAVLARFVARFPEHVAALRAALPERPAGVAFLARGSSDNAAVLGRYAVEVAAGVPSALLASSVHTVYGASIDYTGWVVVSLSQSGRTPEIVTVTERLRRAGAVTVGITNDGSSALASAVDVAVPLEAGEELAVPATKTVTSSLLGVLAVAAALGSLPCTDADLAALPDVVAGLLSDVDSVDAVASSLTHADRVVVTARGLLLSAALETALKLQETTGMLAQGLSTADLRHGPVAATGPGVPVLAIASPGAAEADTRALAGEVRARGARALVLGTQPGDAVSLPDVPEILAAIPAVVRGQQLALATSLARGVDPDQPAGLRKVTPTH
jgi:glucosamine--fructose-6-phosphate aminotransferase (isomerizing)